MAPLFTTSPLPPLLTRAIGPCSTTAPGAWSLDPGRPSLHVALPAAPPQPLLSYLAVARRADESHALRRPEALSTARTSALTCRPPSWVQAAKSDRRLTAGPKGLIGSVVLPWGSSRPPQAGRCRR
ncbi:hypothetical protein NDU88_001220 [Pleurodeles waltl]|uniref:Uncharacterized protein n=1 Tax=Pleurodeles waltl TaxID=8319 RepID=A0AAV7WLP5_PLEWA|nr:hypothetical protein NDU88_001220 [Pleurodeles waltl]